MADRIQIFSGSYVCFFRRNKRTYIILHWDNTARKWLRSSPEFPDLTLHRSSVSRNARVSVDVATYAGAASINIPVIADGFYLKSGETCIPILKPRNSLPQAFMMTEYTALETPFTTTDKVLWTLIPPPPTNPPPLDIKQEKIPKRIAWLVAEDASKNSETCPISTNSISPINASVTTCFHVFETEAINEWVQLHPVNTPCPICRKPCEVTAAFSD